MTPMCFPKGCGKCRFCLWCPTFREAWGKPLPERWEEDEE